jgi:tetratricopeptide (TPR) repeat protein
MKRLVTTAALFSLLAAPAAPQGAASLKHTTSDGRLAPLLDNLGNLHVPVTTKNADAQKFFDQGMRLLYGFNHAEALRSFREAARNDDSCAMAYWGQALALAPNINDSAIGPDREQQGYEAIREALKRKSNASPKEQALIGALAARFAEKPPEGGDRKELNAAYARAMEQVWSRFPDDPNVATLYADAVMNTRPWDYWTKDGKPQPGIANARAALERTIREYPDHPGGHHIYIHLMEASDHIDLAVPSADRLGPMVPGAGHLVHMPSHVYIRVGRYLDAAAANRKAIAADEDYITQCRAQGIYPAAYYPHNIHFLAAALVMAGRSAEAMQAARKASARHGHEVPEELAGFAQLLEALPLLTMVRFGQWAAIEKEAGPAADQPFVRSLYHVARGMAFSATGRPGPAQAELALAQQQAFRPVLKSMKIFDLNSLAEIAEIGVWMLRGDLAEKAGQSDEAVAAFRRAVDIDDSLLYSEPPDWFIPPRQYLAHAYLSAGNAAEAERVYREDLKRHRNNGWALRGLEESLRKQGKTAEADRVRADFERAWRQADVRLSGSRF